MYDLLGFSLTLALLLTINLLATLLATALWRVLAHKATAWPAQLRAGFIFALRFLPAAGAIIFVLALLLPSYIIYEPLHTDEVVSYKLALLATLSAIGLLLAAWRGFAAWSATRKLTADWMRQAEPLQLNGINIPTYTIQHPFPVIAVVGILRPKLFVAHKIFNALTTEEFAAVVAHEQGHLAARDNLKRWVLRACRDVLMIVPCGRSLDRAWAESAEASADEFAAHRSASDALELASALVKIARMVPMGARPTMPAGAFLIGESLEGIGWRVRQLTRLASGQPMPENRADWLPSFVGRVTIFALLLAVALAATNHQVLAALHAMIEHIVAALN